MTQINTKEEILKWELQMDCHTMSQACFDTCIQAMESYHAQFIRDVSSRSTDMTVQEFYSGFNLSFLSEEERQTIYTATELYAKGKFRQPVSGTLEERAKELYPIDYSEKRLTNATEFDIEQQMKLNEKHLAQQQAFLAGASCQQNRCGRWVKSDKNFPAEKGYYFIKELGGGKKVVWFDRVVYDRDGENSVCWTDGKNNYSGYEFESWLDESSPCLCDVYRGALEKIAAQKVEAGETKIDYAFNRNWHIATTALSTK